MVISNKLNREDNLNYRSLLFKNELNPVFTKNIIEEAIENRHEEMKNDSRPQIASGEYTRKMNDVLSHKEEEKIILEYENSEKDKENQKKTIMDMPLNRFNEDIARIAILDKRYNDFVRNNIETEKKRLYKIFRQNGIDYFLSEVNYILIKTSKSKAQIKKDLEKDKIILYASNDIYHDYWVLPIMDKKTNNKVLKVIIDDL